MTTLHSKFVKEQRQANSKRKKNGYKVQEDIKCCSTCIHSSQSSIEDPLTCDLLKTESWTVNDVHELGICKKFKLNED